MDSQQIQNLISMLELARTHHQQLSSFYMTVALGIIGFSLTDAFAKVAKRMRIALCVGFLLFASAIIGSLHTNATVHNSIIAQSKCIPQAKDGEADLKSVFTEIGDTSKLGLVMLHTTIAVLVVVFVVFFVRYDPPSQSKIVSTTAPG